MFRRSSGIVDWDREAMRRGIRLLEDNRETRLVLSNASILSIFVVITNDDFEHEGQALTGLGLSTGVFDWAATTALGGGIVILDPLAVFGL
ncbi:hypothetical protein PQX77_005712 [Marasmius sp. AFHP31]|nr:hypothetical protein PQX77_005712 [Marasmius sp. AFHP31]